MQTYVFSSNLPSIRIPFSYSCLALVQKPPTSKGKHYCTTILLFTSFYAVCIESPPSKTAPTHHDAKVPPRWNSLPTHHGSGFRCWTMPILALCFKSPLSAQRLSTFLEGYHPKIHKKTDKKDDIPPHQPTKLAFSASKNAPSRFDSSIFSRKSPKPYIIINL